MWAFPCSWYVGNCFFLTLEAFLIFSKWKGQYFISATITVKTVLSKSGLTVTVLPKWCNCILFSKSCFQEKEEEGRERRGRGRDPVTKNRVSQLLGEDVKRLGDGMFQDS